MKKLLLIALTALACITPGMAQDEQDEIKTIFGRDRSQGGYFALYGGYSEINNIEGINMGARAAWVAAHGFALGLAGNGFMNNFTSIGVNEQANLAGGYGGILLEPIIFPRAPVHLAFPVVFGAGGVTYTVSTKDAYENNWTSYVEDMDVFFFAEPGAELEFNVTHFLRLAVGASYRITSPIKLETPVDYPVTDDALGGLNIGVSLKFGKF